MKHIFRKLQNENGFSLVELLVAIAVGSIVIALIATAYWTQTQTSKTQQMSIEMQQNIRAALFFMQRDIMMAGYESDSANPAGAGITTATATTLEFTINDPINTEDNIDNDGDGTVDEAEEMDGVDNDGDNETDELDELETIRFSLSGNTLQRALIADTTGNIRNDDNGNPLDEEIARNIEALEFLYFLRDGTVTSTPAANALVNISRIGISVLARTEFESSGYTDTHLYHPLSDDTTWGGTVAGPFNDHFRRELVTTTVQCRNMNMDDLTP